MAGTCQDDGVCTHLGERRGKGEFACTQGCTQGWSCVCALTRGDVCVHIRVCVCGGDAGAFIFPKGTFSPQDCKHCVISDTLLASGLQGCPSPARALQSRQPAQLPGDLPSSRTLLWQATFPNTHMAPHRAWSRPITPRCPLGAAHSRSPPASRHVCCGVWVCLFIGLL